MKGENKIEKGMMSNSDLQEVTETTVNLFSLVVK